jgi:hypothetical protein
MNHFIYESGDCKIITKDCEHALVYGGRIVAVFKSFAVAVVYMRKEFQG